MWPLNRAMLVDWLLSRIAIDPGVKEQDVESAEGRTNVFR